MPTESIAGTTPTQYWVPSIADFWWLSFANIGISGQLGRKFGWFFSFQLFRIKPDVYYFSGWKMTSWLNITINTFCLKRYQNWIASEYYETKEDH